MTIPPCVFGDLSVKHHILLPCVVHLFIPVQDHDLDLVLVDFSLCFSFPDYFSYLLITSGIQTLPFADLEASYRLEM